MLPGIAVSLVVYSIDCKIGEYSIAKRENIKQISLPVMREF
jgi:hypothetical protein